VYLERNRQGSDHDAWIKSAFDVPEVSQDTDTNLHKVQEFNDCITNG
jgi:hypothetical protein